MKIGRILGVLFIGILLTLTAGSRVTLAGTALNVELVHGGDGENLSAWSNNYSYGWSNADYSYLGVIQSPYDQANGGKEEYSIGGNVDKTGACMWQDISIEGWDWEIANSRIKLDASAYLYCPINDGDIAKFIILFLDGSGQTISSVSEKSTADWSWELKQLKSILLPNGTKKIRVELYVDYKGDYRSAFDGISVKLGVATSNPVIGNLNGDSVSFTEGGNPILLDFGSDAVANDNSTNFNGGSISLSIVQNKCSSEDVLTVNNQGTGFGQIGVTGSTISYSGTMIGTYAGGTGGSDLVIILTSNATLEAVGKILQNLTYQNNNKDNPNTSTRTVQVIFKDGEGGTSIGSNITVNITPVNDAPVVTVNTGLTVTEGMTGQIAVTNLSITDVDTNEDNLILTLTTVPVNGTLYKSGVALNAGSTFTQTEITNGIITYIHNGNETTSDSFTFTVSDGAGGTIGATTFSITINLLNPAVTSVNAISENGTYKIGDKLTLTVTFTKKVTVNGTPILWLETGSTDHSAAYVSGSDSTALSFEYIIQAGDSATDLDYTSATALTLNDGTIRNITNLDAVLTLPVPGSVYALAGQKNIVIDGNAPSGYSVTIDQTVINSSNKTSLSITFTGAEVGATYTYSIDDTDVATSAVTGTGTIATATDQIKNINVSSLTDGTLSLTVYLTDVAGNRGINATGTVGKDTGIPVISSVNVPLNGTYTLGKNLDVTLTFTKPVIVNTVNGTPYLTLTLDTGGTVPAAYVSGSGTNVLTFRYTVAAGDRDATGIELAGMITVNGGTLIDSAGNNAILAFTSPDTSGIKVTTTVVSETTVTGSVVVGNTLVITMDSKDYDYIQILVNGKQFGGNYTVTGVSMSFSLPTDSGSYRITIRVYDKVGNHRDFDILYNVRVKYVPGKGDGFGWEMWK